MYDKSNTIHNTCSCWTVITSLVLLLQNTLCHDRWRSRASLGNQVLHIPQGSGDMTHTKLQRVKPTKKRSFRVLASKISNCLAAQTIRSETCCETHANIITHSTVYIYEGGVSALQRYASRILVCFWLAICLARVFENRNLPLIPLKLWNMDNLFFCFEVHRWRDMDTSRWVDTEVLNRCSCMLKYCILEHTSRPTTYFECGFYQHDPLSHPIRMRHSLFEFSNEWSLSYQFSIVLLLLIQTVGRYSIKSPTPPQTISQK